MIRHVHEADPAHDEMTGLLSDTLAVANNLCVGALNQEMISAPPPLWHGEGEFRVEILHRLNELYLLL